jgi:hypothetical protein
LARTLALGLGQGRIAWLSPAPGEGVRVAEPLKALREAVDATGCRALDITVGNDIAVHWLQQPPKSVHSMAELRQVAYVRCSQLYGGGPDAWWVTGDWDAARPFVCAALPQQLVRPLTDATDALRLRVRWRSVWDVACEGRADMIGQQGWNALRSPVAAMVWHCTDGRVDCIARVGTEATQVQADVQEQVDQRVAIERLRDEQLSATPVRWHPMPASPGTADCEAHAALGWRLAPLLGSA